MTAGMTARSSRVLSGVLCWTISHYLSPWVRSSSVACLGGLAGSRFRCAAIKGSLVLRSRTGPLHGILVLGGDKRAPVP
jgi:hypothetical protein